jgi:hypothetical protein
LGKRCVPKYGGLDGDREKMFPRENVGFGNRWGWGEDVSEARRSSKRRWAWKRNGAREKMRPRGEWLVVIKCNTNAFSTP